MQVVKCKGDSMTVQTTNQLSELGKLVERFTKEEGLNKTAVPSLFFIRESQVTEPIHAVFKPSICIILQGEKEVLLAQDRFQYGPQDYIVSSVHLPVIGQVIKASKDAPYLAFKLEFTPREIFGLISDSNSQFERKKNMNRAMYISKADHPLLDAATRLGQLLEKPEHIQVLAPLYKKEILYMVLQGPHGAILRQMAIEGSQTYRISEVIDHIKLNYVSALRIEDLADKANMSVATLHRYFKQVTAMSPIQFQKNLRLQEARRRLLAESTDAAEVAFQVGYESPSQFSREYSRMFGLPPKEDIKQLRANPVQSKNA